MHSDKHIPDVSGALPKVWHSQPSPELWRDSLLQSVGKFIGRAHPLGPLEKSKPCSLRPLPLSSHGRNQGLKKGRGLSQVTLKAQGELSAFSFPVFPLTLEQ